MSGNGFLFDRIEEMIQATGQRDAYSRGLCNGMLFVKSLIDGKEPEYFKANTPTREQLIITTLDEMVSATGQHSENDLAFCNGILYAKSLLENKEPKFLKEITPPPDCKIVKAL